jgi:hypothetical protein
MTYKRILSLLLVVGILLVGLTGTVLPSASDNYRIDWSVITGGGGRSASTDFHVNGSIGQSMAAPPVAGGGNYRVEGGYWGLRMATATPTPLSTPAATPTATPSATPSPPDHWRLYLPVVTKE